MPYGFESAIIRIVGEGAKEGFKEVAENVTKEGLKKVAKKVTMEGVKKVAKSGAKRISRQAATGFVRGTAGKTLEITLTHTGKEAIKKKSAQKLGEMLQELVPNFLNKALPHLQMSLERMP